jgi:hypothetical protein
MDDEWRKARSPLSRTATKYRLVSREGLEQYAGKWIAVRDGEVIATAESHAQLRSNLEVRFDDGTMLAPKRPFFNAIGRLQRPRVRVAPKTNPPSF